jgi:hypothetical protein
MANISWSTSEGIPGDGSFRAWGKGISDALKAVGLVQTSDSGQIDWISVNKIFVGGTAGYEIFRFNDAAQTQSPFFIKLRYGTSTASDSPMLIVDVGSSTDGAGNLSGVGSDVIFNYFLARDVSNTYGSTYSYASGDGSGVFLGNMIDASAPGKSCFILIDRLRNPDGTVNPDFLILIMKRKLDTSVTMYVFDYRDNALNRIMGLERPTAFLPIDLSSPTSTIDSSGNKYLSAYYASFPLGPGILKSKMILCCSAIDFGFGSEEIVNHLGQDRTYKSLGVHANYMDAFQQPGASCAIFWED